MRATVPSGGSQALLLTFDVDWAPEWAIDRCVNLCLDHGWQATFFGTHESGVISAIESSSEFEVGIHPNFLPGSSHGSTHESVLDHCLNLVPGATSMRAHAFVSSNVLTGLIARKCPQIEVDTSILLPFHANLSPVTRRFADASEEVCILPTWLSDMAYANEPTRSWEEPPPEVPGVCVMNVHPIHVVLNSDGQNAYSDLKKFIGDKPLQEVSALEADRFRNRGPGVESWLKIVLKERQCARPGTITEYVRGYRRAPVTG